MARSNAAKYTGSGLKLMLFNLGLIFMFVTLSASPGDGLTWMSRLDMKQQSTAIQAANLG